LWAQHSSGPTEDVVVVRIDPQTNRAVEAIAVGGHPIDVAATGDASWVSVADPGTVLRIAGRQSRPSLIRSVQAVQALIQPGSVRSSSSQ
jgi:DNA-binding beta-propeller fold protein YncE